jgi:hypothetical protein
VTTWQRSARIALFGIPTLIISTTPVIATYPLIHLMAAPLVTLVFGTLFGVAVISAWFARKCRAYPVITHTRYI